MEMQLQDAERKRARLIASCLVFALISIPAHPEKSFRRTASTASETL